MVEKMDVPGKAWYKSKELWTLFISFICLAIQERFGWVVPPQFQGYGLLMIMFFLRWVTKEPIKWEVPHLPKMFMAVLLCVVMIMPLIGCKHRLETLCIRNQKDLKMVDQIIEEAKKRHEKDPNDVTMEDISALYVLRGNTQKDVDISCGISDIL